MELKWEAYPRLLLGPKLGKGAGLRRSAPLELMAHGGQARMWDDALRPGPGRRPTRNLKQLAVRLGWIPRCAGNSISLT
eukprot:1375225-Amphidinium_carterae.1